MLLTHIYNYYIVFIDSCSIPHRSENMPIIEFEGTRVDSDEVIALKRLATGWWLNPIAYRVDIYTREGCLTMSFGDKDKESDSQRMLDRLVGVCGSRLSRLSSYDSVWVAQTEIKECRPSSDALSATFVLKGCGLSVSVGWSTWEEMEAALASIPVCV